MFWKIQLTRIFHPGHFVQPLLKMIAKDDYIRVENQNKSKIISDDFSFRLNKHNNNKGTSMFMLYIISKVMYLIILFWQLALFAFFLSTNLNHRGGFYLNMQYSCTVRDGFYMLITIGFVMVGLASLANTIRFIYLICTMRKKI